MEVGEVKIFSNLGLDVPPGIKVGDYPAVLIWCEAFGKFIAAAKLNCGAPPRQFLGPLVLISLSSG